jgi:hypothetical protein
MVASMADRASHFSKSVTIQGDFPSRSRYQSAHYDGRCLVVPVAVTAGDKIEGLRQWASGRVLSADQPGIYSRESGAVGTSRVRRVMREPGRN